MLPVYQHPVWSGLQSPRGIALQPWTPVTLVWPECPTGPGDVWWGDRHVRPLLVLISQLLRDSREGGGITQPQRPRSTGIGWIPHHCGERWAVPLQGVVYDDMSHPVQTWIWGAWVGGRGELVGAVGLGCNKTRQNPSTYHEIIF